MDERESHIITDRMDPDYVPPALTMNPPKIVTDHDAARATARRFNQAGAHCRVEYSATYGQYTIVMTQDVADRLADHIDQLLIDTDTAIQVAARAICDDLAGTPDGPACDMCTAIARKALTAARQHAREGEPT